MTKKLKKINYIDMVSQKITEDHRIGSDVILLDEYAVDPVFEYEFTSVGNTIIDVLQGEGVITVADKPYRVKGHSLIVYLAGQKIKTTITSTKAVQRGVILSNEFLKELCFSSNKFDEVRYSIKANPVVPLGNINQQNMNLFVGVLKNLANKPYSPEILASTKHAFLSYYYGALYDFIERKLDMETYHGPKLSSKFFDLLQANFIKEHELLFYAKTLGVTRQYLHISVLNTTGKAPGYWVDHYLVKEAKKILSQPDIMICKVAELLNFAGSKQFGRFFKKQTNYTPMEYRQLLKQNLV